MLVRTSSKLRNSSCSSIDLQCELNPTGRQVISRQRAAAGRVALRCGIGTARDTPSRRRTDIDGRQLRAPYCQVGYCRQASPLLDVLRYLFLVSPKHRVRKCPPDFFYLRLCWECQTSTSSSETPGRADACLLVASLVWEPQSSRCLLVTTFPSRRRTIADDQISRHHARHNIRLEREVPVPDRLHVPSPVRACLVFILITKKKTLLTRRL